VTKDYGWDSLSEGELRAIDGKVVEPTDEVSFSRSPTPSAEEKTTAGPSTGWNFQAPSDERIGLALSGGGIRSATFNLGVLQKLDTLGVLPALDYLSTVSGGGYIGAFWSAWKARAGNTDRAFPRWTGGAAEPPEVRHLRKFSNFLRPRPKLLSSETGSMASGIVAAVLPSVTIALSILLLTLLAWLGLAHLLLTSPTLGSIPPWLVPPLAIALLTLAVQGLFEGTWRLGHREEDPATATLVVTALLGAFVTGGTWALLRRAAPAPAEGLLQPIANDHVTVAAKALLLPTAAWLAGIVALVILRLLVSRAVRSWRARSRKSALDRALSRLIFCTLAWAIVALVWLAGRMLAGEGLGSIAALAGSGGAAGGLFAWARRLLGKQPNKPSGGKLHKLAGPWLLTVLAYLVLAAIATATAAALSRLGPDRLPWMVIAAGAILATAIVCFDPQENGFHAFYRQRLVRAFLGASNGQAELGATLECERDDLPLDALPTKPLHLVCCAANDLAADPLGTLHRGAESAVLSCLGLQVGSSWRPWSASSIVPSLGSAMTASAAAFNTQMGSLSVRLGAAATFLLGALDLRLGLWLQNPACRASRLAELWARIQQLFPGLLYLRELAGASRAQSTWIHLSDGAHFENLALYELVRRHCRCILLSDCGADPDVAFDDFGNAVRRVREDFGVEIEIDLEPLRPGEDGVAAQPMVAGDIRYPTGDLGVLLYVKPTLVGDEPPDVSQYARRNERFPHETTLDQFYDEAQWEAYRRLGEHIAGRALDSIADRLKRQRTKRGPDAPFTPSEVIRLFLHARYAWPPDGADDPAVTESVERDWTQLESRLERRSAGTLRHQLVPTDGTVDKPTEKDLIRALPLVREALRLMETTILDTGMGATPHAPSHPRYMGWLNRFGRWAAAPLFRAWWPWLAAVHSQPVREFLESTFGLPAIAHPESTVRPLSKRSRRGYTWSRWAEAQGGRLKDETTQFGLFVPMVGAPNGQLLAGVVAVRLDDGPDGSRASWKQADLFVPPGLWGVGLGERFLAALSDELGSRGVRQITVRSEEQASMAWEALYTGAGFRREGLDLLLDLPADGADGGE